eukprot:Pompholyxophrys_punicea_v1_NODE_230_length_2663_cov_7.318896.p2 type:complete len:169 gc:universal NODE_230_length_2663_cov_7.318896:980-474(-)
MAAYRSALEGYKPRTCMTAVTSSPHMDQRRREPMSLGFKVTKREGLPNLFQYAHTSLFRFAASAFVPHIAPSPIDRVLYILRATCTPAGNFIASEGTVPASRALRTIVSCSTACSSSLGVTDKKAAVPTRPVSAYTRNLLTPLLRLISSNMTKEKSSSHANRREDSRK